VLAVPALGQVQGELAAAVAGGAGGDGDQVAADGGRAGPGVAAAGQDAGGAQEVVGDGGDGQPGGVRQTSSPLLTALTYALTFLPPLVTAPLLVSLADRHPRRTVLVVTDLCRAALVGVMAIPVVPLAGIVPLLIAMVLVAGSLEVTASDGEVRLFRPGDAVLVEDTAGQGHATRSVNGEVIVAVVQG